MNPIFVFVVSAVFLIGINGNPVILARTEKSKPPNCPYGQCYIDRCTRICSCVPMEGSISCTRERSHPERASMECTKPPNKTDTCPLGETYKDPLWTDNFICYCNHHESQTYECIDLTTQKPAEVRDLLLTGNPQYAVKRETGIISGNGKH